MKNLFGDLFKSPATLEKEKRARRRKALRMAERSMDNLNDYVRTHSNALEASRQEAIKAKLTGSKRQYVRALRSIKMKEMTFEKLDKKLWVQEQLFLEMSLTGDDSDFISAARAFQATFDFDIDNAEDVMEGLMDTIKESSTEKLYDRISNNYEKKLNRYSENDDESLLGLEDLDAEISEMAAIKEAEGRAKTGTIKRGANNLTDEAREDLDAVRDLMDQRKKNK